MINHPQLSSFDDFLKEEMNDPAFKKAWADGTLRRQITEQLIEIRIQHKLTQKQLAQKAGMKQPFLARIESGSSTPSLTTLRKIAQAVGKDVVIRFE